MIMNPCLIFQCKRLLAENQDCGNVELIMFVLPGSGGAITAGTGLNIVKDVKVFINLLILPLL